MKKNLISLLILLLSLSVLYAGGNKEIEREYLSTNDRVIEETDSYLTILDSMGQQITIQKPVRTIIALGGAPICYAIRAIHGEEMVIATTKFLQLKKDVFPVMGNQSYLGSYESPDYEKMVLLNPDLIIASYWYPEELEEKLSPDITIIRMVFNSTEPIALLGEILKKKVKAEEYINWIKSKTEAITVKTDSLTEKELTDSFIYYGGDWGMSPPPPYGTYGKDNFLVNGMVRNAGGRCISTDIPGDWINVDPEWIIERNPTLIIRELYVIDENPEMGYQVDDPARMEGLMENILNMPAFSSSDAVKEKNVHIIYGDFVQCYWFIGLNYLAKWFHPNLFEDIDPQAIHQEFTTRFLRLDYKVKDGIFSYTPNR